MKYSDINRRYTEIVAEYMSKGYTINTASMGGSQGETCKIDLTDGADIIRIMVNTFSDWEVNLEGVEIVIGKATEKDVRPHNGSGWNTVWSSRLDITSRERFFKIGEDRTTGTQYGTETEAAIARTLRIERAIAKKPSEQPEKLTGKALEIAKHYIRRRFNVKRICNATLSIRRYNGTYTITYGKLTYTLR